MPDKYTPPGVGKRNVQQAKDRIAESMAREANMNPRAGDLLGGFKKGGKVKKTGPYKLHKGERVLTARQAKAAPRKRK
jgi:hypothetical protein